jgi:Lipopolysaccharide export system permease LptF/LptG
MTRRPDPRLPGDRLRSMASHACSATAMTRLIDPVIADLQAEYADALRRGQRWRRRWIRLAGYVAFWKVFGLHATIRAVPVVREWAAADDHAMGRTLVFSGIAIAIFTVLFILPILLTTIGSEYIIQRITRDELWRLLLLLVPAMPVAIPIGFAAGIVCGLRGRLATARVQRSIVVLAVAGTVVMFAVLAWVAPAANQAFRELVAHRPVPRGMNELTLGELRANGQRFAYHQRWALAPATIVLGLFAYSLSAAMRGKARSIAIGIPASIVYVFFYLVTAVPVLTGWLAPSIAAWMPNIMFVTATVVLMRKRVHI